METLVKIPPDPDSRIVKFLVWFLGSIRVTDLSLQISLVLLVEQPQSVPVGPLSVGVDIHLDDSIVDGVPDLLLTGARPPVHHQEQRFVVLTAQLLLGKVLVTLQKVRREHHVARFVDSVDVTEGSSDGEHGGDGRESLVDVIDLLWLGVETLSLHRSVVHPVLLAPGDADLHLQEEFHLGHPFEISDTGGDVLLVKFLTQVQHVGGEERLSV